MKPDDFSQLIEDANKAALMAASLGTEESLHRVSLLSVEAPKSDVLPVVTKLEKNIQSSTSPVFQSKNTEDSDLAPGHESSRHSRMEWQAPEIEPFEEDAVSQGADVEPSVTDPDLTWTLRVWNENEALDDTSDLFINGTLVGRYSGADLADERFTFVGSVLQGKPTAELNVVQVVDNGNGNYMQFFLYNPFGVEVGWADGGLGLHELTTGL